MAKKRELTQQLNNELAELATRNSAYDADHGDTAVLDGLLAQVGSTLDAYDALLEWQEAKEAGPHPDADYYTVNLAGGLQIHRARCKKCGTECATSAVRRHIDSPACKKKQEAHKKPTEAATAAES